MAALASYVGFVSANAVIQEKVGMIEGVVNVNSIVRFENRMTSLEARVATEEFVGQSRGAAIQRMTDRIVELEKSLDRLEYTSIPKSCAVR